MENMNDILDELMCPVCLQYCDEAMHCLNCNKVFCNTCVVIGGKPIPCPLCRKNVNFTESKLARRMIGNLPANCPNSCPDKFTRESLKAHTLKCPNRKYKCKLCQVETSKEDFVNHLVNDHSNNLIEQYDEVQQVKKPVNNISSSSIIIPQVVANKPIIIPGNRVKYVGFKANKTHEYKGKTVGTNKVDDLYDQSLMKGICCDRPAELIIEFDKVYKFNMIHVGGYNADKYSWSFSNGNGSEIFTSLDGNQWVFVGNLVLADKSHVAEIKTNIVSTTEAKFIKFRNKGYLGLGYLGIPYI
jgi:hypothetical protein